VTIACSSSGDADDSWLLKLRPNDLGLMAFKNRKPGADAWHFPGVFLLWGLWPHKLADKTEKRNMERNSPVVPFS
jgi:hypothetical protein